MRKFLIIFSILFIIGCQPRNFSTEHKKISSQDTRQKQENKNKEEAIFTNTMWKIASTSIQLEIIWKWLCGTLTW